MYELRPRSLQHFPVQNVADIDIDVVLAGVAGVRLSATISAFALR